MEGTYNQERRTLGDIEDAIVASIRARTRGWIERPALDRAVAARFHLSTKGNDVLAISVGNALRALLSRGVVREHCIVRYSVVEEANQL